MGGNRSTHYPGKWIVSVRVRTEHPVQPLLYLSISKPYQLSSSDPPVSTVGWYHDGLRKFLFFLLPVFNVHFTDLRESEGTCCPIRHPCLDVMLWLTILPSPQEVKTFPKRTDSNLEDRTTTSRESFWRNHQSQTTIELFWRRSMIQDVWKKTENPWTVEMDRTVKDCLCLCLCVLCRDCICLCVMGLNPWYTNRVRWTDLRDPGSVFLG